MTIGLILLVLAALEFFVGFRFIFTYQKGPTSLFFGLFCIGSAVYVGANGMGYTGWVVTPTVAERLAWAGGAIATSFFLPFSMSFPFARQTIPTLLAVSLWPIALFVPGFLFSSAFIAPEKNIPIFGSGYATSTGPYFTLFVVFLAVYWAWSLANLVGSFFRSDGLHRWQIKIVFLGTLASLLVTVFFDVYMPLTTVSRLGYVGSLATSAWLGATAFVLLRK